MGECNLGITWSIFNLIIGITIICANVLWIFGGFSLCSAFNVLFGLSIAWVAITTKFCDQYALRWFPFWNNFLFMGLTFIYFACGVGGCFNDFSIMCFLFFFILVVGVLYVILWLLKTLASVAVPDPVPLETIC